MAYLCLPIQSLIQSAQILWDDHSHIQRQRRPWNPCLGRCLQKWWPTALSRSHITPGRDLCPLSTCPNSLLEEDAWATGHGRVSWLCQDCWAVLGNWTDEVSAVCQRDEEGHQLVPVRNATGLLLCLHCLCAEEYDPSVASVWNGDWRKGHHDVDPCSYYIILFAD